MLKPNLKIALTSLSILLMLISCNKDEDQTNQDTNKAEFETAGYFKGTITGTRRDGTAFVDTFRYEYAPSIEAFSQQTLSLVRFAKPLIQRSPTFEMNLSFDEGATPVISTLFNEPIKFQFWKEVGQGSIFVLNSSPFFEEIEGYVAEISVAENETYGFFRDEPNSNLTYYESYFSGPTLEGNAYEFGAYFNDNPIGVFYSSTTGELMGIYDHNTQTYLEEGDAVEFYNDLTFSNNEDLDLMVFFDAATGESLHEEVAAIPADILEISNYHQDEETGIITFDYELTNGGRYNSTTHPLTITGSFHSGARVYNEVVFRTR